ncbi:Fc.00g017970.m01.CDS01 [Cosmosporella sp. VM-42]
MTTQVEIKSAPMSHIRRRSSGTSTLPPDYSSTTCIELSQLTPTSSQASLPQYDAIYENTGSSSSSDPSGFHPTKHLQIKAQGLRCLAFPLPPRPDPIYIFNVAPTGTYEQAEYISIRPTRGSGSCYLVKADDPQHTPICTTTYRWGPGKPPKIQLLAGNTASTKAPDYTEEIEIDCKGCFTRTTSMRTHLGTFEWRYASRAERKALSGDNVLILDRVTTVALEGGKQEVRRRKVAQLVRNSEFRTEGTKKSTAGNGGRLMVDLREWADRKDEAGQMEMLAVASCITMLKKEVDRRRMHQTIAIMAGASGGS